MLPTVPTSVRTKALRTLMSNDGSLSEGLSLIAEAAIADIVRSKTVRAAKRAETDIAVSFLVNVIRLPMNSKYRFLPRRRRAGSLIETSSLRIAIDRTGHGSDSHRTEVASRR